MLTFNGWRGEYALSDQLVAAMKAAIDERMCDEYTPDEGATLFKGESVSYLTDWLRSRGFKLPGLMCDQETLYKALGYRVAKARAVRTYRNNKKRFAAPCTVVSCPITAAMEPN